MRVRQGVYELIEAVLRTDGSEMTMETVLSYRCRLCAGLFSDEEMSEEHYPARSVGNNDIVYLDIAKLLSDEIKEEYCTRLSMGESIEAINDEVFDTKLTESVFPKGRTARTLCKKCNTFLGKYDEAYLKFFNADGNPGVINGFQISTKYEIIKAIFAKFLSVPETQNESFDFIDFIKDQNLREYTGKWNLYFVKRDFSSDLLGFKDIGTGKATFSEGVVYEFSDDKFIFNLMNFEKHSCFNMTNIFDILKKNYTLVVGVGESGGYHASILLPRLLSQMRESECDD